MPSSVELGLSRMLAGVVAGGTFVCAAILSVPLPAHSQQSAPVSGPTSGPGSASGSPSTTLAPIPKLPPTVFARVGDRDITAADIVAYLNAVGGVPLTQQCVQIAVAEELAQKAGVTISPAELDDAVRQQEQNIVQKQLMQTGQSMTFAQIAARQGVTEGVIRQQTRFHLLVNKVYAATVAGRDATLKGKIRISHLLISTDPNPADGGTPDTLAARAKREADALAKADALRTDITAAKISWQQAIDADSDDQNKVRDHGDMGWIDKSTLLTPEFLSAALKLTAIGEISPPVKSDFGYHLFRLDGIGDAATPDQIAGFRKSEQEKQMQPQAIAAWIGGVMQSESIFFNPTATLNGVTLAPKHTTTASAAHAAHG